MDVYIDKCVRCGLPRPCQHDIRRRHLYTKPFSILEGLSYIPRYADDRDQRIQQLLSDIRRSDKNTLPRRKK